MCLYHTRRHADVLRRDGVRNSNVRLHRDDGDARNVGMPPHPHDDGVHGTHGGDAPLRDVAYPIPLSILQRLRLSQSQTI